MSLSESQREILLSASLDDSLSPEEQVLLDQWFGEDPSALRQRDEMAALSEQLRAALAPTRAAKLDQGFAQRVVEAAIEQAQRENLAATHPLVRLAGQAERNASMKPCGKPMRRHWLAASLALAASLLLTIYLGWPAGNHGPEEQPRVAHADAAGQALEDVVQESLEDVVQESIAAIDGELPVEAATADQSEIAASAHPDRSIAVLPPLDENARPAGEDDTRPQTEAFPLAFVLVVSVEMTPAGRESLTLMQALRHADIQIGPSGVVTENVVSHLQQTHVIQASNGDGAAKLYYIEAPAKQLDRFLLRLMAEKDSVASFGFSIADNPPLLASVMDWRKVDPTKLRHTNLSAIARDLVSSDGTPLAIDRGRALISVPPGMDIGELLAGPTAADSNADDIPSQILLLVR